MTVSSLFLHSLQFLVQIQFNVVVNFYIGAWICFWISLFFNPKIYFDLVVVMTTVKSSSRARATAASVKENGVKLEEGLTPFKSDRFDAEFYVQSNSSLNDKVHFRVLRFFFFFAFFAYSRLTTCRFVLLNLILFDPLFLFWLRDFVFVLVLKVLLLFLDDYFTA